MKFELSDKMEKSSPIRAQKKVGRQSRQKEHVQRHCDIKNKKQHTRGSTIMSGRLELRVYESRRWE